MLSDLVNEAAKLKDTPATREIPTEKLSQLLIVLQWNIRDGAKLIPMAEQACDYCLQELGSSSSV